MNYKIVLFILLKLINDRKWYIDRVYKLRNISQAMKISTYIIFSAISIYLVIYKITWTYIYIRKLVESDLKICYTKKINIWRVMALLKAVPNIRDIRMFTMTRHDTFGNSCRIFIKVYVYYYCCILFLFENFVCKIIYFGYFFFLLIYFCLFSKYK